MRMSNVYQPMVRAMGYVPRAVPKVLHAAFDGGVLETYADVEALKVAARARASGMPIDIEGLERDVGAETYPTQKPYTAG